MFGRGGANLNKEELRVGMATTPKKGLITLTTGQEEEPFSGENLLSQRKQLIYTNTKIPKAIIMIFSPQLCN